jgi:hypothetical protein
MIFLFILSCGNPDPNIVDSSEVIELWNRNQNAAVSKLKQYPNEQRIAIVQKIISSPKLNKNPKLCSALEEETRNYCETLLDRSHIWEYEIIKRNQENKNTAISASASFYPSRMFNIPAPKRLETTGCKQHPATSWCYQTLAAKKAKKGKLDDAASLCQSISTQKSKEECFFYASEQALRHHGAKVLTKASHFCQLSNIYTSHCYAHSIEILSLIDENLKKTPWTKIQQISTQITQTWKEIDPTFAIQLTDYYWALISQQIYINQYATKEIPSEAPKQVIRHLRAAKAFHHLASRKKIDQSLEAWRDEIINADIIIQGKSSPIRELWPRVNNNNIENSFLSTYYLSNQKRPYMEDTTEDWNVAILFALIQHQFPLHTIKESSYNNPVIPWLIAISQSKNK